MLRIATVVRRSPQLHGRFAAFVVFTTGWLAPALLVYVSLEPAVLSALPREWYWPLRLLPDGLIGLLFLASVIAAGHRQPRPNILGLVVIATVGFVTAVTVVRGQSASDAINSLRVVVRYLLLGLTFWTVASANRRVVDRILAAIALASAIQLMAAAAEVLQWLGGGGSALAIPALDGWTGRYDRLGLLLMLTILTLLAHRRAAGRTFGVALPILLAALFLTSSRQAEVALSAGCLTLALLPPQSLRTRLTFGLVGVVALVMLIGTPTRIAIAGPEDAPLPVDAPVVSATAAPRAPDLSVQPKGSTQFSVDPNRNFRLYLLMSVAPWAGTQEPLFGLGPGAHVAERTDPRLEAKVIGDGTTWAWARQFMNDSTYASWIVQFGVILPALLLIAIGAAFVSLVRSANGPLADPVTNLAVAVTAGVAVAAAFGPVFETRISSLCFWLVICSALAVRGSKARGRLTRPFGSMV